MNDDMNDDAPAIFFGIPAPELFTVDKNGNPERCPEFLQWAQWMEANPQALRVANDLICGVRVSTVLLAVGGQ